MSSSSPLVELTTRRFAPRSPREAGTDSGLLTGRRHPRTRRPATPHSPWHHRFVTSSSLEHLARTAYEAHRGAHPADLPPWEETPEQEQQAWRAAVSAVAAQTGTTLIEKAPPARSLVIQSGDKRHTFQADFTAGRQGNLPISDEFASGHHCRFRVAHGLWLVEDLGSTNSTWLNGRRFQAAQRLTKGDKIKIAQIEETVVTACSRSGP